MHQHRHQLQRPTDVRDGKGHRDHLVGLLAGPAANHHGARRHQQRPVAVQDPLRCAAGAGCEEHPGHLGAVPAGYGRLGEGGRAFGEGVIDRDDLGCGGDCATHRDMVDTAPHAWHQQESRLRVGDGGVQLALTVLCDDRRLDRAQPRQCEAHQDGVEPGGQLPRHPAASADTARGERGGHGRRAFPQLRERHRAALLIDKADLAGGSLRPQVQELAEGVSPQQAGREDVPLVGRFDRHRTPVHDAWPK